MKSYVVVTGGAGFIGSNLVRTLNEKGISNIIIVDTFGESGKWQNLLKTSFIDMINYEQTIEEMDLAIRDIPLSAVFHIGANTDVLVRDTDKMLDHNFEHSKFWLKTALKRDIPFIYASSSAVYGNSENFDIDRKNEYPHNAYAFSKLVLDNYVRHIMTDGNTSKIIGLRFFNVYGLGEWFKGRNASLPFRFYEFIRDKGYIDLFEEADKIQRDYIWVNDVCEMIFRAYESDIENGIYNLGSGSPISHADLARLVVKTFIEEEIICGDVEDFIKSIPMPVEIAESFQYYTKARLPGWMEDYNFVSPSEGIAHYIRQLVRMEEFNRFF